MLKLNVRTIFIIVFVITTISVSYQKIGVQFLALFSTILMLFLVQSSEEKWKKLKKRLQHIVKLLIILFIIQVLFHQEGKILLNLHFITITEEGLKYGLTIILRFLIIIFIAGLLFSISFYEYITALRKWKVPYELAFLVASVIHFIPLFEKELKRKQETIKLRGIKIKNIPFRKRSKALATILFPSIAQAISDLNYRAISLELRGFRIHPNRTYLYDFKLEFWDWIFQILFTTALILSFFLL